MTTTLPIEPAEPGCGDAWRRHGPGTVHAAPRLAALQSWMAHTGADTLSVSFRGGHGSGEFRIENPDSLPSARIGDRPLQDAVEEFGFELLGSLYPGWQEESGSDGDLVIGLRDARLDFNEIREVRREPVTYDLTGPSWPAEDLGRLQQWMKDHGVENAIVDLYGRASEAGYHFDSVKPEGCRDARIDRQPLVNIVLDLAATLMERDVGGWSNDLGGEGRLTITPDAATAEIEYLEEKGFPRPPLTLLPGPEPQPDALPSP